jgi:hypothetical protein
VEELLRYEQVQALKDEGKNVTTVMRELRLAPARVRETLQ